MRIIQKASGRSLQLTRQDWQAIGRQAGWLSKQATGEADQDYDHETYDAICKWLTRKTGQPCTHKEFDKYQGIYISVRGLRIWTVDGFVTGKRQSATSPYRKAVLVAKDGNSYSATPGDYFNMKPDAVFTGSTLVITKQDGSEQRIENPKKSDLVQVDGYIRYEGEPDQVFVMWIDGTPEEQKYQVRVSPDGNIVSDSGLAEALQARLKGKVSG
jgi:hypothetical protein